MKTIKIILIAAMLGFTFQHASAQCEDRARIAIAQRAADPFIKTKIGALKEDLRRKNSKFGEGYWQNTTAPGSAVWYSCTENKACALWAEIYGKYQQTGDEQGWLGLPVTDRFDVPGGAGALFQGGSIYWSPKNGAHTIGGKIRDKWVKAGHENSNMTGFPKSDERDCPNNIGKFQEFEYGNIYWKAGANEAFIVFGDIWKKWGELGYEKGMLGFPTSDHAGTPTKPGAFMSFEHGNIYWNQNTGSHYIPYGPIWDAYAANKWEQGNLGFPAGDPYKDGDGTMSQKFQGGKIEGNRVIWY